MQYDDLHFREPFLGSGAIAAPWSNGGKTDFTYGTGARAGAVGALDADALCQLQSYFLLPRHDPSFVCDVTLSGAPGASTAGIQFNGSVSGDAFGVAFTSAGAILLYLNRSGLVMETVSLGSWTADVEFKVECWLDIAHRGYIYASLNDGTPVSIAYGAPCCTYTPCLRTNSGGAAGATMTVRNLVLGADLTRGAEAVMNFDGGDRVDGAAITAPSTNPFSIGAWINVNAFPGGAAYGMITSDPVTADLYWALYGADSVMLVAGAFFHECTGLSTIMTGFWRRAWFIRPSGASVKIQLWVDGAMFAEDTHSGNPNCTGVNLRIGSLVPGLHDINARMGHVEYLDRALSAAEIAADFAGSTPTGLVRHWKLDNLSGGKTHEEIGDTEDTVTGAVLAYTEDAPWFAA